MKTSLPLVVLSLIISASFFACADPGKQANEKIGKELDSIRQQITEKAASLPDN